MIDEAAQSSELSTLTALQFGSSHAVLVGDTHQLPATIFSVSGRSTKFDRSLFQRLEEAGHKVHMLNTQYRMHPVISAFPRHIFYGGMLLDGPNVRSPRFGGDLKDIITMKFPKFQQFNFLDLDSMEERDGTSLCNRDEAELVLHLYRSIDQESEGIVARTQVAIITPYSQQVSLLRRMFGDAYGASYEKRVEIRYATVLIVCMFFNSSPYQSRIIVRCATALLMLFREGRVRLSSFLAFEQGINLVGLVFSATSNA